MLQPHLWLPRGRAGLTHLPSGTRDPNFLWGTSLSLEAHPSAQDGAWEKQVETFVELRKERKSKMPKAVLTEIVVS